jgi:glucose/arabinose dehydrogenase
MDGQIVNPSDVHMETGPFADPDLGDQHLCTDWEIWTVAPPERVWFIACIGGVERVHTHLGDGTFENSHAGRTELRYETSYRLRVRHRDDSGDPGTQWSEWSERLFATGPQSRIFPMEMDDVADAPTPQWLDELGVEVVLPGGANPPSLRLESAAGELLLEVAGLDGQANRITNPPELGAHVPVRVQIAAGANSGLALPVSRLGFTDHEGIDRTVYLPSVSLASGERAFLWVSDNGGTYVGNGSQTQPDFSTLAQGAPVPWRVDRRGFKVEIVARGLQLPVNIAFVPNSGPNPDDPCYYVTELYGTIKVVSRDGTVSDYASGLLNFNPTGAFPGSGEQGLTGIAVDPVTGDVFAGMLYDSDPPMGDHYPKVVRFHSDDGGRTAATQTTILDMVGETQGQSHQISNLSIGPDGRLYVHMGDGFASETALNLASYRGKILSMNLDGSPSEDNPLYNPGNGINSRDYMFAYGFRNPFGGAWRAADGLHYEVENGPNIDRFAQVVAGRNYRWDGNESSMRNFAAYIWDRSEAPVNIAFVQPETFGGSGFPPELMGMAYVTESGPTWGGGPQALGKQIVEFELDAAGQVIGGPSPIITYTGSGKATAVGLAAGPEGLYFTDLYKDLDYASPIDRGANVLRIQWVGVADFTADVTSALKPPLTVQFTDASSVPSPAAWAWDFGDGATSDQRDPSHQYNELGSFNVRLRVTGANGVSAVQKNAFVRIGRTWRIALVTGSSSPGASDQSIVDHLRALGYEVEAFDDDPGNRPTAEQLAADFDLVVLSSTISSGNIAGQFRSVAVPLVYWEQALNGTAREPLAEGGVVVGNATAIDVLDNSHAITFGLDTGSHTAFSTPANMSVAHAAYGPDVRILATRAGAAGDAAVMAADAGAVLLGGHAAPARRAFLFFEDSSWLSATETSRRIFDQAVVWALGIECERPCDVNCDGQTDAFDIEPFIQLLTGGGSPCAYCAGDANRDGVVDAFDIEPFIECLVR